MQSTNKAINPKKQKGQKALFKKSLKPFDYFNVLFFILLAIIMIIPFWSVLMTSLVDSGEATRRVFIIWPEKFNFFSYQYILSSDRIPRSFLVTVAMTVCGTVWSMFLTTTIAYALSKKYLVGRNIFLGLITFTMFFGGGLIPFYLLITKTLHMNDTFWVLFIPTGFSVMSFVMIKAFFNQIPVSMEESARIDGANDIYIFFRIILPLSLPAIATFSLFYAVGMWNQYFNPMLFLPKSPELHPLQLVLRKIVVEGSRKEFDQKMKQMFGNVNVFEDGVKYATVMVATAPILILYPFLQKYFTKGIYVGSVKG